MRNTELSEIAGIWTIQNKKKNKLKGYGLINFESRINLTNSISEEIKLNIERRFADKKGR